MAKKFIVKNPGCQFCQFYQGPFTFHQKETQEVCTKNAKRIFQPVSPDTKKRTWKWIQCSDPKEINAKRTCPDFEIPFILHQLQNFLLKKLRRLGGQHPPSLSGEKWWDT